MSGTVTRKVTLRLLGGVFSCALEVERRVRGAIRAKTMQVKRLNKVLFMYWILTNSRCGSMEKGGLCFEKLDGVVDGDIKNTASCRMQTRRASGGGLSIR